MRVSRLVLVLAAALSMLVGASPASGAVVAPSSRSSELLSPPQVLVTAVVKYKNCAALNQVYKHGVGKPGARDKVRGSTKPVTNFTRNLAVYNANTGRDGDKDGVACEKR